MFPTNNNLMEVLSEDKIEQWIVPHLSVGKRGFRTKVKLGKIVQLILKRLKTGCQWRMLYVQEYIQDTSLSWYSVYYYFNKWSKEGCFKKIWISLLREHKRYLDMSSVQIDGSHTRSRNGGEAVGYQGRKSGKTSNSIFVCDSKGQMLSVSEPRSGVHNDVYEIAEVMQELLDVLQEAGIETRWLFVNADAGFDTASFRGECERREMEANVRENERNKKQSNDDYRHFDEQLYEQRTVIERANAWMDAFKALMRHAMKQKPVIGCLCNGSLLLFGSLKN